MIGTLNYKINFQVQLIACNPSSRPYQSLKVALLHLYKISDNDRFDQLFNCTKLGDGKRSELLSEMRTLLRASGTQSLNKLLENHFSIKLPPQVRTILADRRNHPYSLPHNALMTF